MDCYPGLNHAQASVGSESNYRGHTIPRLTIPHGVLATLDSRRNLFSFAEPVVTVTAGD